MAKKSFLNDNPALAYISKYDDNKQDAEHTQNVNNTPDVEYAQKKTKKKKPTKSRRVHFLMTPDLHAQMLTLAYMECISLNELANRLMEEYAASKQERINKYHELMAED